MEYLLHRRLESTGCWGAKDRRGAVGEGEKQWCSSPSALCQGDLRGGAGWVCLAGVLEGCQDCRSDGEHVEGAKVGV